jgi:hypothetical protein
MKSVYHIVAIRVKETSWAHVWMLHSRYLERGYDTPVPYGDTTRHSVRCVNVCTHSGFPTLFTPNNCLANLQVSQTRTQVWDLVFSFLFAWSCWLFRCWFCRLWDWSKKHLWYLSFSWIFSCLLVSSQTVFCHTINHRVRVCSYS